jgi:hypothetical protein
VVHGKGKGEEMSAQEAFEKWREGLPTVTRWEKTAFLAGRASLIEEIRNGGAVVRVK